MSHASRVCRGGQRAGEVEEGDGGVTAPEGLCAGTACFGEKLGAKRVLAQDIPTPDSAVEGWPGLYWLCQQAPPSIKSAPAPDDVELDVDCVGARRCGRVEVRTGNHRCEAELHEHSSV